MILKTKEASYATNTVTKRCSEWRRQALMRHANVSVTMNTYVQAVTPAKRKAQRGIIKQIREVAPDPNLKCLQVLEKMVGAIGFEPMTSTV